MGQLETPDLCAHIDRLKRLCADLEDAQDDKTRYRALVDLIQIEVDALRNMVCRIDVEGVRRKGQLNVPVSQSPNR